MNHEKFDRMKQKKSTKIDAISKLISKENEAVLVDLENGNFSIITKYDIISAM